MTRRTRMMRSWDSSVSMIERSTEVETSSSIRPRRGQAVRDAKGSALRYYTT